MVHKNRNKKNKALLNTFFIFVILIITGYYFFCIIIRSNFQEVVPGKIYRSAQPSSSDLKKWAKKYGIKTVINLRARKPEDFKKEKETAEQLGIKFIPINLSGNRLITREELLILIEALDQAETPVLLHCQSGIDRAGTSSALAAIAISGLDYDIAKRQAFVPPGPWKREDFSKKRAGYIHDYAHISDTLKLYENYCDSNDIDKNDWQQFVLWANNLPPIEDLDIKYESSYSYFPFIYKNKKFFPILSLLKDSYVQFTVLMMIIFLLTYSKTHNHVL